MADRLGVGAPSLLEALRVREDAASTVIGRGLAIPHVVVDGKGTFDILLARCRKGIAFDGDPCPVHAAFVLIGTADERNFHLRALAAIAQVVQAPDFEARWMAARGEQALRDLVLLGERRRG